MFAPKRNEHPLHYWISLWPTAPLFGIPWRFEAFVPGATFIRPSDIAAKMTKAGAAEAGRTMGERARTVAKQTEKAAETIEAAATGVEKAAKAQPAVARTLETDLGSPGVATEPPPSFGDAAPGPVPAESPAASPEPAPVSAEETASAPAFAPSVLYATAPEKVDDLKLIKGVGPKMEAMLNEMGIYRFDQIASFTPENVNWVSDNLASFKGRPLSDDWVSQAKSLA